MRGIPGLAWWLAAITACVVAGAVVLALWGGGAVGLTVGWTLIGAAGVLVVSLVFYAVGVSEDRERARERDPAQGRPGG